MTVMPLGGGGGGGGGWEGEGAGGRDLGRNKKRVFCVFLILLVLFGKKTIFKNRKH